MTLQFPTPIDSMASEPSSLVELLDLHDEAFVRAAYHVVLRRVPDVEGMAYYLKRLRRGISKLEILEQLRYSKEGQACNVKFAGMDNAIREDRWLRIPYIGALLSRRNDFSEKLRAIENQIYILNEASSSQSNQLNKLVNLVQDLLIQHETKNKPKANLPELAILANRDPLISIITPCYKTSEYYLERLSMSLWPVHNVVEWVVVNDSPEMTHIDEFMTRMRNSFPHLSYVRHEFNKGIFAAYASGVTAASSPYIAILDHDDEVDLVPLVTKIKQFPYHYDLIYTNEVKFGQDQHDYYVKPAFDPLSAMHYFYAHHITCFRTDICKTLISNEPNAINDYKSCFDIWLAFGYLQHFQNKIIKVAHLPYPAYGWRVHDQSTAKSLDQKPIAESERLQIAQRLYTPLDSLANIELDSSIRYVVRYKYSISTGADRLGFFDLLSSLFVISNHSSQPAPVDLSSPEISSLIESLSNVPLVYLAHFVCGRCIVVKRADIPINEPFFEFVKLHVPCVPILKSLESIDALDIDRLIKISVGVVEPKHMTIANEIQSITNLLIV